MKIDDATWASALSLEGGEILASIGREAAERVYNGIGADWMGGRLTAALAALAPVAAPAAVVHDAEYAFATPRSLAAFLAANRRFEANLLSEARRRWRRHPSKARAAEGAAAAARLALDLCGMPAWRAAWRKEHPRKK